MVVLDMVTCDPSQSTILDCEACVFQCVQLTFTVEDPRWLCITYLNFYGVFGADNDPLFDADGVRFEKMAFGMQILENTRSVDLHGLF